MAHRLIECKVNPLQKKKTVGRVNVMEGAGAVIFEWFAEDRLKPSGIW